MSAGTLTAIDAWTGKKPLRAWVEFYGVDAANAAHTYAWSGVAYTHAASRYGGYKEPRVLTLGHYDRELSGPMGRLSGSVCSFRLSDVDSLLRAQLENTYQRYLRGREVVIRVITADDDIAGLDPLILFRGIVQTYRANPDMSFTFDCWDWLSAKIAQPVRLPVLVDDFPDMPPTDQTAVGKIWYGQHVGVGGSGACPVTYVGPYAGTTLALDQDPTIPPSTDDGNAGAGTGTITVDVHTAITAIKAGKESPAIFGFLGTDDDSPHSVRQWFKTNGAGADSYRVYFFDRPGWDPANPVAPQTYIRMKTHNNTTFDGASGFDFVVELTDWTDGSDFLNPSNVKHMFVLAAHAVKSIDRVCQGGAAVLATKRGVSVFLPGDTGYPLAHAYYDAPSGQRYQPIFLSNTDAADAISGTRPVTCDVSGVETIGDGTGTLLRTGLEALAHFLDNYVLPDTPYAGGAWGSTPTWADSTPRRDAALFTTAATAAAIALTSVARATGITTLEALLDILASLVNQSDLTYGFSRAGQFRILLEPTTDPAGPVLDLQEYVHVEQGSFDWEDLQDSSVYYNRAAYNFNPQYAADGGLTYLNADVRVNGAAVTAMRATVDAAETVNLIGVHDATAAAELIDRRLARAAQTWRVVRFRVPLWVAVTVDLGDVTTLTHRAGPGGSGFARRALQVRKVIPQLDLGVVDLECRDLRIDVPLPWLLGVSGRTELGVTTDLVGGSGS